MIRMEFGIIDQFDQQGEYDRYEPERYHCLTLDDELYMDRWFEEAQDMPTCFHRASNPQRAFARWGITLIPPTSLPRFAEIVQTDPLFDRHPELSQLLDMIRRAQQEEKWMIHFGV